MASSINVNQKSLLERCARQFRDYPQYKDDLRYVKICLRYADLCPDPRGIFQALEDHEIGIHTSMFYRVRPAHLVVPVPSVCLRSRALYPTNLMLIPIPFPAFLRFARPYVSLEVFLLYHFLPYF